MPPLHGTTPSEHQPPELFGRHISDQHRAAAAFEECDDPLPLLRRGVEARPTQRLGYLGLLPDELGRDGVLDDEDPSPAIGKAGGRRSGERRLPGAEELSAWPIERVDGKLEALRDGPELRLAGKVAPHS